MTLHYLEAGDSTGKSTADTDIVHALYIEVFPGCRVAFEVNFVSEDPAYAGTMVMSWELSETDGGTEVVFRAENVPAGISAEDHAAGLASSLRQLQAYLASGSQSSPQPGPYPPP